MEWSQSSHYHALYPSSTSALHTTSFLQFLVFNTHSLSPLQLPDAAVLSLRTPASQPLSEVILMGLGGLPWLPKARRACLPSIDLYGTHCFSLKYLLVFNYNRGTFNWAPLGANWCFQIPLSDVLTDCPVRQMLVTSACLVSSPLQLPPAELHAYSE